MQSNIFKYFLNNLFYYKEFYVSTAARKESFIYNKKISILKFNPRFYRYYSAKEKYALFFRGSSRTELLDALQKKNSLSFYKPGILLACCYGVLVSCHLVYDNFLSLRGILYMLVPLSITFCINFFQKFHYNVYIHYNLNDTHSLLFDRLKENLVRSVSSHFTWDILSREPNTNVKYYAGSKEIFHRKIIALKKKLPLFIFTNSDVFSLAFDAATLYFFPDCILVQQKHNYSMIRYDSLIIDYKEFPFKEYLFHPQDAKQIGSTWLHLKKDGKPDKRFADNPKVPINVYGEVVFSLRQNVTLHMLFSNHEIAHRFARFFATLGATCHEERFSAKKKTYQKQHSAHAHKKKQDASSPSSRPISPEHHAYMTLGLTPGATLQEITKAYRTLVKKYHPDMHAHKGDAYVKIAEEKVKEVIDAYETLRKNLARP